MQLKYRNRGNASLLELINRPPGRLLDCGCGAGDNAALLGHAGWRVTGVTVDPAEAEAAAPYCDSVLVADLEDGVPAAAGAGFDAILLSHVLEHLRDPDRFLAAVRHRLRPGGVIAVALPNVLHYRQRLAFLKGQFRYTDTGPLDRTHLRFYSVAAAQELVESSGYRIVTERADGGFPWMLLRRVVPASWRSRVDAFVLRRWPGLFAWQVLLIAAPGRAPGTGLG